MCLIGMFWGSSHTSKNVWCLEAVWVNFNSPEKKTSGFHRQRHVTKLHDLNMGVEPKIGGKKKQIIHLFIGFSMK